MTPDYTTAIVLAQLVDLETRIAAGEQPEPGTAIVVSAPGRATLIFGLGGLTLDEQAALQRRWLARHAVPVELRAQWDGQL